MMMPRVLQPVHSSSKQRGFTLLEILIAMLIGLFMVGALLVIVQSNRSTFIDQGKLATLQDGERVAMNILAEVIQSSGYFPDPTASTFSSAFPADSTYSFLAGQYVTGTASAAAPGDAITIRYVTAPGDGILNCSGTSNTTPGNQPYVNQFSVIGGVLTCTMNGVQYPLVSGITNLAIYYGVNSTGSGNNVDSYLKANQMTAASWTNVISVMVQLTVTNPLYQAGKTGQPANFNFQRVIGVMNKSGPSV